MPNYLANNYPQPVRPPSILGMLGQVQGLVHQAQVNRLTGAQIAMGQNYAQATGPNGQINEGQLTSLTANNPQTSMLTGQTFLQGQQRVHAQADAQTAQLGYAMTQNADINQIIGSALTNPTSKNIQNHVVQLTSMKVISPTQAADLISSLPPGNDPKENAKWILGHQLQNQQVGEQLKTMFGNYQVFSTGAHNVVARVSPVTGIHPVVSFPQQLSPQTLAEPFSYVDPKTGATQTTSLGVFLGKHGLLPGTQGAPNIAAPGAVMGGPEGQGQTAPNAMQLAQMQAVQKQLQTQGGGASMPVPPQAGVPAGPQQQAPAVQTQVGSSMPQTQGAGMPGVETAIGPGQQQALAVSGHQSATALASLEADVGNGQAGSQARLVRMQLALNALQKSATGGGTQVVQETQNYIQSMSNALGANWVARMLGMQPEQALAKLHELDPTAQRAVAQKYLTQMAMAQANLYGPETNEKLATAIEGTPNTQMPQLAAEDVLKVLMGMEKYHQAEYASWQQHVQTHPNVGAQDFLPWSAQWTLKTDPRIFLTPYMTPAQTAKLEKQIPKADQAQFIAQWKEMKARGLL